MGSSSHLYNLSWGEFSKSLSSAAELLRGHGEMVDVTLAAGGRSFSAHKIVLCAASPFLLDLLKSTPCQHPVIMLAGIGGDDLESLLDFVYRGEVSVEPSQLPSLLQAAHCLSIQGLTPPTILSDNGHETSTPTIPVSNEAVSRDVLNSFLPLRGRKRRRKSSTSSGKCHRPNHNTDTENRPLDGYSLENRTTDCEGKDNDDIAAGDDTVSERSEFSNNPSHSPQPQHLMPITPATSQQTVQTEQSDAEPHLHTLMPMQPYSPLHIPSFPSSLNIGLPPGMPIPMATSSSLSAAAAVAAAAAGSSKVRGASDCPGVCPLCGATLRQARNLRRHLLYSCKYRFSSSAEQLHASADAMVIEIKPEVDIPGYIGQPLNYGTDSGGSNSCEQIVCNPSPLPSPSPHDPNMVSPQDSNVVSSHGSGALSPHGLNMILTHGSNMVSPHENAPSPTVAR